MSEWTSEEIARAAGLEMPEYWEVRDGDTVGQWPDWADDPGACAKWLLPVLERRFKWLEFRKSGRMDELWYVCIGSSGEVFAKYYLTWHECVIAAIMASAEGK